MFFQSKIDLVFSKPPYVGGNYAQLLSLSSVLGVMVNNIA